MTRWTSLGLLALGVVVAAVVTLGARQGLKWVYRNDLDSRLEQARVAIRDISADVDRLRQQESPDLAARTRVAITAEGAVAVLDPLVDSASLRGSFLELEDAGNRHRAATLRSDLADLAESARKPDAPVTEIAARTDHALQSASGQDAGLAEHLRQTWTQAYARDLTAVDTDVVAQLDDFQGWRQQQFADWMVADRWGEIEARADRAIASAQASGDRVSHLPAPPELEPAARQYQAALSHLEEYARGFRVYVAGKATVDRSLRLGEEELKAYQDNRDEALATIAAKAGRSR